MADTTYWCSAPPSDFVRLAMPKIRMCGEPVDPGNRLMHLIAAYYGKGRYGQSSAVRDEGRFGEYRSLHLNELRRNMTYVISIIAGSRLSFTTVSSNDDVEAKNATMIGKQLLQGYSEVLDVTGHARRAAEFAFITTEGWLRIGWDVGLGEDVAVQDGRPVRTGDAILTSHDRFSVIYNRTTANCPWRVLVEPANRWDLTAKYPDREELIRGLPQWRSPYGSDLPGLSYTSDEDQVALYTFYHGRTASIPLGRELAFVSDSPDGWLYDYDLGADEIPLYKMSPGDVLCSGHSYTPALDAVGANDAMDRLFGCALTNGLGFGLQNVLAPEGQVITNEITSGGVNLIRWKPQPQLVNSGQPTSLQMSGTPAEVFSSMYFCRELVADMLGVTTSTRGEPEKRLSGDALAMLDSRSYEFLSSAQASYQRMVEQAMQGLLVMLRNRAGVERVGRMVGDYGRVFYGPWSSKSLAGLKQVSVQIDNPIASRHGGRIGMANALLERGQIEHPEDYFDVVNHGRIESVTLPPRQKAIYVQHENEAMLAGRPPVVQWTDDDEYHLHGHAIVGQSPLTLSDPRLMRVFLDHQYQHELNKRLKAAGVVPGEGGTPTAADVQRGQEMAAGEGVGGFADGSQTLPVVDAGFRGGAGGNGR